MKKILYTLALVSFGYFTASAQDAKTETAADPNAAEISFEKEVHDFGTLEFGGDGNYDFKFTNTGKSPLIISSAQGSCGCTVPKWPKEPIKKGESSVINVHYDTKRPGPFTKTVTINSNAKTPVKVVTIKGTVMTQEETESMTPFKKADKSAVPLESPAKNN